MTEQSFFSLNLLFPVAFTFATVVLFITAMRAFPRSETRNILLFFAVNCFSLSACLGADMLGTSTIHPNLLKALPLILTFLYLVGGGLLRSPSLWAVGLATPGLWYLCQKIDQLWFKISLFSAPLPQDPGWLLLLGGVLFLLLLYARFQAFWETMEGPELTASACYFMGGLWLLGIGVKSVLVVLGFHISLWAILLLILAGIVLWIAKLLDDRVLAFCGFLGVVGSLYAGAVYIFTPVAG